jgi:UDP-N-acetylglucosamine transferase subunit ALG13
LIFVTVGTHYQGFERLIKAVDELIKKGKIKEDVTIQIGYSNYIPENCKWFRFLDSGDFIKFLKKSNIVITHGGIGSIVIPLQLKKTVIVVPRYKKFLEHTNDHQLQITKYLENQKKIIAVYDINNLEKAIVKAKNFSPTKLKRKNKIINLIEDFVEKT